MAHKKGAGSTKNGRDSKTRKLGDKRRGVQYDKEEDILIRQLSLIF